MFDIRESRGEVLVSVLFWKYKLNGHKENQVERLYYAPLTGELFSFFLSFLEKKYIYISVL